ncbi:HAD family hydrolase [Couchioplanes caeruleus]|uniref:Putative hydrolase of the HAD superfamily n=1 Tax=Couchioplanes caeruleus TaxID=56438 RepID=A0A3N1GF67_9ACTN|nr:HAD family hydrolase [Couchioplanes caeruleus]ROP28844.1 putative hydrolase of the HAD superfamily [Couchioplanes caeruleus]
MLRAVLFDLDDTLIDHESAAREAVVAWASELGITDPEVPRRWARVSDRHLARYQRRELTFREQRRERVRDFLPGPLTDREADDLFAGYLVRYEAGWRAFEDAIPTLRRARAAGLPVAVLTNGDEAQQRRKLDRLSLSAEIDLMVASSMVPAGKPDPRAFQHTVALLGLDVSDVLMVGDSLRKDVLAARAAGLQAVLVDRTDAHRGAGVPRVCSLHELVLAR